ncbi:MAG: hypothetical protein PVF73_00350 [Bacteroidales bacterium]|jgi:hypothetical protein
MKTMDSEYLIDSKRPVPVKNRFFRAHLYKNSFRGFWYDTGERSYGIKLSFAEQNTSLLKLYAQDSKGEAAVFEYEIKSDDLHIGQISNDKVVISTSDYKARLIEPSGAVLKIPPYIEFTLQLLSHNSVFIQFHDYNMYSPPINHLARGLVLAREHKE